MAESPDAQAGLPFNLSISSFVAHILSLGFLPHDRFVLWLEANSWLPQFLLFAYFAVCFLIILYRAYRTDSKGFDPFVFMACSIGACLIPVISFDYKLATLPSSIVLLIPALQAFKECRNRFMVILLTFLFSGAYSSTLYLYIYKPEWLQYNLPALFLMLTICTLLCFARPEKSAAASLCPRATWNEAET